MMNTECRSTAQELATALETVGKSTPKLLSAFTPVGPRLLVEKIEMGEQKIGNVVIAQTVGGPAKWKPVAVRVVHPGTGRLNQHTGSRDSPLFAKGDTLILASFREYSLIVGTREYFIVPEEDVLGPAELVDA